MDKPYEQMDDLVPNSGHVCCFSLYHPVRWWFQTFFMFTSTWGNDPLFDEYIFQMGGKNHQLGTYLPPLKCFFDTYHRWIL